VLAAAAQFDNDVKAERTRAGMMAAMQMGRWCHQAPLGYQTGIKPGASLTADPERAELIGRAFEDVAAGATERDALRAITAAGLRSRKGRGLAAQTFAAILRNPVYVGRIDLPKWGVSQAGDWVPIVTVETFSRVQGRKRHGWHSKPHTRLHPDFPLRVFVRCAHCETPLTGSWSRGRSARYAYYSCRRCGHVRARREELETRFMERLRNLQPNPAYMRLFNAIVRDVWKEQEADARKTREQATVALAAVERREHLLNSAFIYEKPIDEKTYAAQRDKLREEGTLLEIQLHESRLEELDLEALLAFAEQVLTDAARMWSEASLEQRVRLQAVFFPKGLTFDGERFGTAASCLAFSDLQQIRGDENDVASQSVPSWNQIHEWLKSLRELRDLGIAA
jgi:hypothetical protein